MKRGKLLALLLLVIILIPTSHAGFFKKISGLVSSDQCSLFSENFNNIDEWDFSNAAGVPVEIGDGWSTINDNGDQVLKGMGHVWANVGDEKWTNYIFKTNIKLIHGAVHINFRKGYDGRYFLGVGEQGLYMNKQFNQWSEFADLERIETPIVLNQWHTLVVEAKGNNIKVYIDDVLIIDHTDLNPLTSGSIAFETLDDSIVLFYDVGVDGDCVEEVIIDPGKCTTEGDRKCIYYDESKGGPSHWVQFCNKINMAWTNEKECPNGCENGACVGENSYDEKCKDYGVISAPPDFTPDETHSGSLILNGAETMVIDGKKFLQQGNVYINDQAKLIIRNSQFALGRGDVPTIHVYIIVGEGASLEIENSMIFPEIAPEGVMGGLVIVRTSGGTVNIKDSPTSIHLLEVSGGEINIINSSMIFDIGGLLQVGGGKINVVDSTIGAIGLTVPPEAHLTLEGLRSGNYFESWDVHQIIPEANYGLTMQRSCILKDEFTGYLEHGPFERGWQFFIDPSSHVRITNSELRKAFIDFINDNLELKDLKMDTPSSLRYRDIILKDVIMKGQWPLTVINSAINISNSEYLFFRPTGNKDIRMRNSQVVEFIPNGFTGTIFYENSEWINAGEIISGVDYHCDGCVTNNFTIKGSLKIGLDVREHLQWKNSFVTREYDVAVNDENGNPVKGSSVKIDGKTAMTDEYGKAKFSLLLDESNYNKPHKLEVYMGTDLIAQKDIDFFTETPITIGKAPTTSCVCQLYYNPVCGVDGKTYSNSCNAGCNNAEIGCTGECPCASKECSGCLDQDNKCIPYGIRTGTRYCDLSGSFVEQKSEGISCNNNFECSTNICINNKCIGKGVWEKFLRWFNRIFNRKG